MTSNAKEWGVTLLRFWFGFVIAYAGWRAAKDNAAVYDLARVFGIWRAPLADIVFHASILVKLIGGTAILAGVAVRFASAFVAAAAAFDLWRSGPLGIDTFIYNREIVSMLVASLSFLMLGAGRLNLGALLGRR